jgi:Lipocalin-like domain
MNPRGILAACTTAALALCLLSVSTVGQQQSLKEQLVGTWTLVSWEQTNADGTTSQQFGANPKGIAFFDAGGRYIITVMRSDRAKYVIDNFGQIAQSTAEENKATAQGTITYFGTYSVSEPDRTIAIHVEASSFPNWNGTDQKRFFAITEDQLKLTVRPPRGGSVDVLWKRAK